MQQRLLAFYSEHALPYLRARQRSVPKPTSSVDCLNPPAQLSSKATEASSKAAEPSSVLGYWSPYETLLPSTMAQSTIDGRNGSNACTIISAIYVRNSLLAAAADADVDLSIGAMCVALRNGNEVYDALHTNRLLSADEVLDLMGVKNNPTLQVAKELEKIALEDDYFVQKKLYPNVDFYSGIILEAMEFPTSMFTPIFALARTVGWLSQWQEMISDPNIKIGRPRQLFTGATHRNYVTLDER